MEVGGARVLSVNETYITSQGTDAARGKGRTGKEQEIRRQKKECEWDPVSERREADTRRVSVPSDDRRKWPWRWWAEERKCLW